MLTFKEINQSIKNEMVEVVYELSKNNFKVTVYKMSNGIIFHFEYFNEVAKLYKMKESFSFCLESENAEKLLSEKINDTLLNIYNNFLTVTTQDEFKELLKTKVFSIDNNLKISKNSKEPLIHFYKNDDNGFFGIENKFENKYYLTNNKELFNIILMSNGLEKF